MICPYNRKGEVQKQQWTQVYDEEGRVISGSTVTVYEFPSMECCREHCGAWHNGRCCYASVNLDNE
jgi:hypothetical protein